ncbi:MAG: hypothetical protein JW778_01420, partial [Candidatus Altiarchaeota archaeon]|nr:hypothetical protein [Candidatus Altiarchaeota archaeon]
RLTYDYDPEESPIPQILVSTMKTGVNPNPTAVTSSNSSELGFGCENWVNPGPHVSSQSCTL